MSLEGATKIIFAIVFVSCGLMWPFLLCNCGTFATERIQSIYLTVYNANWFDYPQGGKTSFSLLPNPGQISISMDSIY